MPDLRELHEDALTSDAEQLVAPGRGERSVDSARVRGWVPHLGKRVEY
jgi:hypothetical protein